jgi:hypothetical protein
MLIYLALCSIAGDYQLTFCLQENLLTLKSQDKGNKILKVIMFCVPICE